MAITLKADNRQLTKNAKLSYLADNNTSGKTTLVIVNSSSFSADDYILIGEFGNETTEVLQVDTIDTVTQTLTLTSATIFAHPESTKITVLPYNQVKFYWTATPTYATGTPVTGYIDLQADDFFSKASDTTHTTGYGWFVFYNSTTSHATVQSNPIPYGDFEANSVKKIFDSFFSLLNNNELKLISNDDAFRWLNEGYAIATNELNLVNRDYNVASVYPINLTAGTKEYSLPADFGDLISVSNDIDGSEVLFIYIKDVDYNDIQQPFRLKYYIRGTYMGFSPTPLVDSTVNIFYNKRSTVLTSYYDDIDLPDNNFYPLVDFMLYRAAQKLQKPNPENALQLFRNGLDTMKVISIKRDSNLDTFGIAKESNV